jgi:hypothetical protein
VAQSDQQYEMRGKVVPFVGEDTQPSDLFDFFQQNKLGEFLPLLREYYKRNGFPVECNRIVRVNSVADLMKIDPNQVRAFFKRRDIYEPMQPQDSMVPAPSAEAIERVINILKAITREE